ncbi:MAG: hypothetical protein LBH91_01095 [Prevotellaceae bacterium]|jgi:hypothetical protein|nr:hypothetical protein [Prevotellaceae bacterium]
MWSDWEKKVKPNAQLPKKLFWDVDWANFDLQKNKKLVVQRVIEYGLPEDYYTLFKLYGGVSGVREIIKEIPCFRYPRDISFVCMTFNLKKEDLECYKRQQLRKERMNS